MGFPFRSLSFQRLGPKRKMSGATSTTGVIPALGDPYAAIATMEHAVRLDDDKNKSEVLLKGPINGGGGNNIGGSGAATSTTKWFCGLCRTVDVREVVAFVIWEALTVLIAVLGVGNWVFFFRFVVEPMEQGARLRNGALWATWGVLLYHLRSQMRARCGSHMGSLADHAEIFVATSMAMVFSTNIAFYLHEPSSTPLKDLGFMLIPAQSEHSRWRPLSDLMTALLPIFFMVQSYLMTRENRCRVMSTFFRVATVSYALRMLTVSLTSLPGPAPHCRPGSPLYAPPESWIDVVTRVGPMYGKFYSCGDLIFSGHMAYTNTAMLLYLRTLDRYFVRFSRLRWALGGLYLVTLAVLCVAGRKHYTVDIVLGLIISTLVYFHFEHSWIPVCLQHPEAYALHVARQTANRRSGCSTQRRKSDLDFYDLEAASGLGFMGDDDQHGKGQRIVIVEPDDVETQLLLYRSTKGLVEMAPT